MTKQKQIYKCSVCGNIIEVIHASVGQLVCCGKPTELLIEKSQDVGQEKHQPVLETGGGKIKVRVGSIAHPMEESHYIEWIEVIIDGKYCRKFLKPGDLPEAEFCLTGEKIESRIYCNIHGLWGK